jgi:tetratricopeptide (TPR) repeat protein
VLQRGSVEGRVFHMGAVQELSPDEGRLPARLTALVRKELIRPDKAQLPGEEAFRFRHLLIRDAAYDALPKATRAELHERYADWLEQHGAELVELDEMLGYHLEQADRYRNELGQPATGLGDRAAARLAAAGRRALDRGDMDGASNLLERAVALLEEDDPARIELEVDLGEALVEGGRLPEAETLLEKTVTRAASAGGELLRARAQVRLASVRTQTRGAQAHAEIRRELEPLVTLFEEAADHRGASDTLNLLGKLTTWAGDFGAGYGLHDRALRHARAAGDERREAISVRYIVSDAFWGPEHVDAALARCRAILEETSNRRVQANCLIRIGGLEGLAGRFDAARAAVGQARAIMDDFGLRHLKAHSTDVAVLIELLAGEPEAAEAEARTAHAVLEEMGDRTYAASEAYLVAEALVEQGRFDEADAWLVAEDAWRAGESEDEALRARILAHRGLLSEAEAIVRAALAEGSEPPVPSFTDARFALAEILAQAGRHEEARQAAEQCLARYEAKGIVPLVEKARALLADLRV